MGEIFIHTYNEIQLTGDQSRDTFFHSLFFNRTRVSRSKIQFVQELKPLDHTKRHRFTL